MDAQAVDIIGKLPPLDLGAYSHIEVCGLLVEVRDGTLTIRAPYGRLVVLPVVSNTIELRAE